MVNRHFLDNLWRWKCGIPEQEPSRPVSYSELAESEWSLFFEQAMRNRLIMGGLRYGRLGDSQKPAYDRIREARKRLDRYEETGNDELLVDIANMMLLEFVEGSHPLKHFQSQDDGPHAEIIRSQR